jgi:hypothetical protein
MDHGERCIRVATRADMAEIGELRVSEYKRSGEFTVIDPTNLVWGERDDADVTLAAWDEAGRALATMRGSIVTARREAETLLECSLPEGASALPALILGRAATRNAYRRSGLNSALRYYFLSSALDAPIRSVLGVVFEHAPRTELMKSLGYVFLSPGRSWTKEVQVIQPRLIASLDRSMIQDACERLRARVGSTLADYPWRGGLPRFTVTALDSLGTPNARPGGSTESGCVAAGRGGLARA